MCCVFCYNSRADFDFEIATGLRLCFDVLSHENECVGKQLVGCIWCQTYFKAINELTEEEYFRVGDIVYSGGKNYRTECALLYG